LDRKGVVQYVRISRSHGDRTTAAAILTEVKKLAAE
jgi:hypothetical protein